MLLVLRCEEKSFTKSKEHDILFSIYSLGFFIGKDFSISKEKKIKKTKQDKDKTFFTQKTCQTDGRKTYKDAATKLAAVVPARKTIRPHTTARGRW